MAVSPVHELTRDETQEVGMSADLASRRSSCSAQAAIPPAESLVRQGARLDLGRLTFAAYAVDCRRTVRKADGKLPILPVTCAAGAGAFASFTTGAAPPELKPLEPPPSDAAMGCTSSGGTIATPPRPVQSNTIPANSWNCAARTIVTGTGAARVIPQQV
jgi:hypothetical protein